jgi:hypothetical protein
VPTLERASLEVGNVRRVPDEKFRLSCGENQETKSPADVCRADRKYFQAGIFKYVMWTDKRKAFALSVQNHT